MSPTPLPARASAVVVGGGVTGASVAWHLAKLGWQDVLLLERRRFACGTTWHAAGLIGAMRASESHARLVGYSRGLLDELEAETGQSTGFREVGSLSIAHSTDRWEELRRTKAMNDAFGVTRVDLVTPEEIAALFPPIDVAGLVGGTFVPADGKANPTEIATAFVKGARARGATCLEGVRVEDVAVGNGRVRGVVAVDEREGAGGARHEIAADFVVNAGGMWAREFARRSGLNVPLHACEHYYAVTEKLEGIDPDLPVLRDHDECVYVKEDAGGLLVGAFEKEGRAWGQGGIPADFCFDELPGHVEEQLMPVLEAATARVPILADAGWRRFFCGPESFTPDDRFHVGEVPGARGYFVAAGMNSIGIQSAGAIGRACAEWMHDGHPSVDLWENDIRRTYPFQGTQAYLEERVTESLGLLYARHYPYRQFGTSRNVRLSPVHARLAERGACFGEVAGWERPNWFAPEGVDPSYEYAFGRQNWFERAAAEHRAAREGVALFDQSSFSKYLVQGRDALGALQAISTADLDVEPGRIVYTHWLNARGGIEADLTVTRLDERRFLVISGAAVTHRDLDWLDRRIDPDAACAVTDVSNAWAIFGVMGPRSRAMLEPVLGVDLSDAAFPFGASREAEIGYAPVRATRVSYVGELGWEIAVPVEMALPALDRLLEAGAAHGLALAGMHALDNLRLEKRFLHFGHDVGEEDTPLEAGVGFVCAWDKPGGFLGREALLARREAGEHRRRRLVQFLLEDPEPQLWHHEPILRGGEIAGFLTSGGYGHTLGGAVGLGYVRSETPIDAAWIEAGDWTIDVGGERVAARASLRAMYDPHGERMRPAGA